jgi:hypothetical protein
MNVPIACTGHLLVDIPIFAGPVFVLGGWLVWTTMKARRSQDDSSASPARG